MDQGAVVISVLEFWDSCICGLSPGPEASYVEETVICTVLKIDSGVFIRNLLQHCHQVDEESRSKYALLF